MVYVYLFYMSAKVPMRLDPINIPTMYAELERATLPSSSHVKSNCIHFNKQLL